MNKEQKEIIKTNHFKYFFSQLHLVLLLAAVLVFPCVSALVSSGIIYVSDSYYISQIERQVVKALDIKNNTQISSKEKSSQIAAAQKHAHSYNERIVLRTKRSSEAIDQLDEQALKGY